MAKLLNLLSSIRFWQLTAGVILIILGYYSILPQELVNILAGYLGVSITIGTVDKFAKK